MLLPPASTGFKLAPKKQRLTFAMLRDWADELDQFCAECGDEITVALELRALAFRPMFCRGADGQLSHFEPTARVARTSNAMPVQVNYIEVARKPLGARRMERSKQVALQVKVGRLPEVMALVDSLHRQPAADGSLPSAMEAAAAQLIWSLRWIDRDHMHQRILHKANVGRKQLLSIPLIDGSF